MFVLNGISASSVDVRRETFAGLDQNRIEWKEI